MDSQSLGIYFGHRKLGIQSQKNEEKEIKYNLIYDLDGTCLSNVYIFPWSSSFGSIFFFIINMGVQVSLHVPRLIPQALKLTTM
jgi:hypothetical protein